MCYSSERWASNDSFLSERGCYSAGEVMIDFNHVSKLLGGRDILNDVSFCINKGERIGIVGPNGAGKTTLFSLINGDSTPDKGEILKPEKIRLGLLRQQLGFFQENEPLISFVEAASGELGKIQEQIHRLEHQLAEKQLESSELESAMNKLGHLQSSFETMGGYEMTHKAEAALAGLGFKNEDFHKAMGDFSGGWQMRAAMARILLGDPDVLLLDEPSNYLDIPAVEWLQRRLKIYRGTLLLISHDRFLLNSLTTVTVEVNGGKVTRYPGNYLYYIHEREERKRISDAAQKNTDRKRQQLESNINRFRAKATKAAQVQSWIKMLDKLDDVELPEDLHFNGTIRIPDPPRCGHETMRLEGISHSYDGEHWILRDINLNVECGCKLGIVGYNGMGKSTLLKIMAGRFAPSEGTRVPGHKVVIGYQAQEFAELLPAEQSAFDVVKAAAAGTETTGQRVREILGAFGFSGDSALKQCKVLSGGEKIRLCFARIFVNPPNLLILDEPTTHLDIAAREALQEALRSYQGTVCLVSHDVEFLRGSATEILEMRSPGVKRYPGNYDYYREKIAGESAAASQPPQKEECGGKESVETVDSSVNQKEMRREKAARRQSMAADKKRFEKEVAKLEKSIERLEGEKEELIAQLASPSPETDYGALQKKLKNLDYDLSLATLDWEKTAAEQEAFLKIYDSI